jgi:cytochrome c oxidase subunit 3
LILESKSGFLTFFIKDFLKYSFLLFIFREFIFFFRIFWFYFDSRLSQNFENFENWVPKNINLLNPFSLPLINTFILLRSGFRITIFHNNLNKNKKNNLRLLITIFLALLFLLIQKKEYSEILFRIKDSVFRTIFFFSTGFHGFHVLIGLIFIFINYIRINNLEFNYKNIISFEFSIIYWHFVDVIWLFLFVFIYWWRY